MNTCTGERYKNEHFFLAQTPGWHGKFGHLNVKELDHESACTGYGKHDRIVSFCPEGILGEARIDHVWGLGTPSDSDIIKEFKSRNAIKGKWRVLRREPWPCGKHTDVYLTK